MFLNTTAQPRNNSSSFFPVYDLSIGVACLMLAYFVVMCAISLLSGCTASLWLEIRFWIRHPGWRFSCWRTHCQQTSWRSSSWCRPMRSVNSTIKMGKNKCKSQTHSRTCAVLNSVETSGVALWYTLMSIFCAFNDQLLKICSILIWTDVFVHFWPTLGNDALESLNLIPSNKEKKQTDASFTSKKHKLQNTTFNSQQLNRISDSCLVSYCAIQCNRPRDESHLLPLKILLKTYFHTWTVAHLINLMYVYAVWIVWYTVVCKLVWWDLSLIVST